MISIANFLTYLYKNNMFFRILKVKNQCKQNKITEVTKAPIRLLCITISRYYSTIDTIGLK